MVLSRSKPNNLENGEFFKCSAFLFLEGILLVYGTDKIKIVTNTRDKNGVKTRTVGNEIDARIKDSNKIVVNDRGEEVTGNMIIMVEVEKTVNYGDEIIITKRFGSEYKLKDKYFKIHKIEDIGGMSSYYTRLTI